MQHSLPPNHLIDRVAGTEIGVLWLLPAYSLAAGVHALAIKDAKPGLALTWSIIAMSALSLLGWIVVERHAARQLMRQLLTRLDPSLYAEPRPHYEGGEITGLDQLVQYEGTVGLIFVQATFRTRPSLRPSPIVPVLVTLIFGWWSFPGGIIATIRALGTNLKGGHRRSVTELIVALREPQKPLSPWWHRIVGFDRGIGHVAAHFAALLIIGLLFLIAMYAISREALQNR